MLSARGSSATQIDVGMLGSFKTGDREGAGGLNQDERARLQARVGELVIRLLPFSIAVVASFFFPANNPGEVVAHALVAGTWGFALTLWLESKSTQDRLARLEAGLKDKDFTIRVLESEEERVRAVKRLYASSNTKIYATHIDYRSNDLETADARKDDWAAHLYAGPAATNRVFRRIVSVSSDADRQWVADMSSASTNSEFRVAILEGEPNQLPYPNMVLVEGDQSLEAFISFRGATARGDGTFAFTTASPTFVRGLIDHFETFFADLPKAPVCVSEWLSKGLIEVPVEQGQLPVPEAGEAVND